MDILYQFNEKYAVYAGVSITSLFENNKNYSITVHILGEGLSSSSIEKLMYIGKKYNQRVLFYETDQVINMMRELEIPSYRGAYSANLRMFISYFIGEDIERLLYLDADTIIEGNIEDLFSLDLQDNIVGMVIDSLGNSSRRDELNLPDGEPYFNSGVILYDLRHWRSEQITEKIINYASTHVVKYASPDQDLLNIVLHGKINTLSPKYNFQPFHKVYKYEQYINSFGSKGYYSKSIIEEAAKDVRIYHSFRYLGDFPWNRNSIHPYKDLFDKYLCYEPWTDYEKTPSEATFAMMLRPSQPDPELA